MAKRKEEKKVSVYPFALSVTLLIIVLVYIYNPQNTEQQPSMMKISGRTVEPLAEEKVVEKKKYYSMTSKLDECLQDCQYKICKKNCELNNNIEAKCFRECLDECNNKCLRVYS